MYSHIVELPEKLQEKVSNRLCDLHKRIDEQDEDVQSLFEGFEEELMEDEDLGEGFLDVLFPYLNSEKILRMADMMAGPVGRFARYILSASYYELFLKFLQIEEQCAFYVIFTVLVAEIKELCVILQRSLEQKTYRLRHSHSPPRTKGVNLRKSVGALCAGVLTIAGVCGELGMRGNILHIFNFIIGRTKNIKIMALIKCQECGKEISDKAVSCPNCGNPINQQTQKEEYLCCPKCGSRELHAEHKGFSGGKALAGALVTGGLGLLAGTIGSRETQITCLKCGNKFKAGEARVIKNISDSDVTEEEKKILDIIQSQGLISAVKWYKDNHGCGLAEANTYVDSLATKHNVQSASGNGCAILILFGLGATLGSFFLF